MLPGTWTLLGIPALPGCLAVDVIEGLTFAGATKPRPLIFDRNPHPRLELCRIKHLIDFITQNGIVGIYPQLRG